VAQISSRVGVGACTVGDVNIMASTECGSIATVSIHGIFGFFDVKLEGFQSIFVSKGEYEAVRRVFVGTTRI